MNRALVCMLGLLLGRCTRTAPAGAPADGQAEEIARAGTQAAPTGGASATAGGDDMGAPERARSQILSDPEQAQQARRRLVDQIELLERPWGDSEWFPGVMDQMRAVPRHLFMPRASIQAAYRDSPHPIGYGQTISQPTIVALMTNALRLGGGDDRVLEIGTGSGYQAAVLSGLVRTVHSIEIVRPLGEAAKIRLARLGYENVHVRIGDGYQGWPEHAPFDRIILTAAPPEIPQALVDQLGPGGILVAPVGDDSQELVRWIRGTNGLHKERLGGVRFVPMVHDGPE